MKQIKEVLVTIILKQGEPVVCLSNEIQTKDTMVIGIDNDNREGFMIPLSNIAIMYDGEIHETD